MAGLDAAIQKELTSILDQLHTSGMTIIIATHDLDFAYGWADEVIVMQTGQVVAHGNPAEVLQRKDVQNTLGAAPLVAEITRQLSLIGIELRDKEYVPRSTHELLKALTAYSTQEKNS
jgi:cobalt/nickel transport system ATP-binding protein